MKMKVATVKRVTGESHSPGEGEKENKTMINIQCKMSFK
jgi:hypothetical protein